jgi:hypothetical protein
VKLIQSVLILPILTLFLIISGCSQVKQLEIFKQEVKRAPLNLEGPPPLKMENIDWIIVTEDNYKKVFEDLKKKKKDVVIFGLTDDGYEVLSMNNAQVRNYIILQGYVLKKYKEYYENGTEETSSGK